MAIIQSFLFVLELFLLRLLNRPEPAFIGTEDGLWVDDGSKVLNFLVLGHAVVHAVVRHLFGGFALFCYFGNSIASLLVSLLLTCCGVLVLLHDGRKHFIGISAVCQAQLLSA